MTPLAAILLASLIQPAYPGLMDALAHRHFSALGEDNQPFVAALNDVPSEPVVPAARNLFFAFPNRHDFTMMDQNEALKPEAIREFSHFVRCYRTNKEKAIAPRLIEIVLAAVQHFGVDTVEVISGYRNRPYGAPHSKHFLGQALDIRLVGIPSTRLAEWLWSSFHGVGVGYYPRQNFVHVDTRETDVRWVDTARRGESGTARFFTRTGRELLVSKAQSLASESDMRLASTTSRPAL